MPSATSVTVIIPAYNRATWLEEAVRSVINTGHPNLEILIVDDGSTDDTYEVARALADKSGGNIRAIQHPDKMNHGAGPTRNLGIGAARGEYVCFLDSDDCVLPHRFETSVAKLDSDPSIDGVYEWTRTEILPGGEARIGTVRPIVSFDCENPEDVLEKILNDGKHWSMNAILLRKEILTRVGGFSDGPGAGHGLEDLVLWLKLACVAALVKGSENPVAVYRMHGQNISTSGALSVTPAPLLAYLEVFRWAKKNGVAGEKLEILRSAVLGKLFFVCDRCRRNEHSRSALQSVLMVIPHVPSLLLMKLFWRNFLYLVRYCVVPYSEVKEAS